MERGNLRLATSDAERGALLQCMLADISIEVSARGDEVLVLASRGAGTQTFLPWLPKTTPQALIEAAACHARLGLRPIPHLAARRLASEAEARRTLDRLRSEAAVDAVLLVGGERASPSGPYASVMDLLRSGIAQASGIRRIGFGGYPEGHPAIPTHVLNDSIELKLRYAQEHGLEAFIVSQFCFDGAAIVAWAHRLRSCGVTVPIRIGLAGPTPLRKLLQLGIRCGIGESLRALRGRFGAMTRLAATYAPSELLSGMTAQLERTPVRGPLALHVFAFGGVRAAADWLDEASVAATR